MPPTPLKFLPTALLFFVLRLFDFFWEWDKPSHGYMEHSRWPKSTSFERSILWLQLVFCNIAKKPAVWRARQLHDWLTVWLNAVIYHHSFRYAIYFCFQQCGKVSQSFPSLSGCDTSPFKCIFLTRENSHAFCKKIVVLVLESWKKLHNCVSSFQFASRDTRKAPFEL